jgi:integrase
MVGSVTDLKLQYVHGYRDRHGVYRYYVRRKGFPRVALPGLPGSAAFMAAYQEALGIGEKPAQPSRGGARSLSALIATFYRSPHFLNLADGSKKAYRHVLKHVEALDGHRGVADMPDDKARKIIEEIGIDRPALANLTRSVMRKLFKHAIALKWRSSNPFASIETYAGGTHHTWTDAELAGYEKRWPVGSRERLAFDLLYYTAQRVGDVAAMKRSDIIKSEIHLVQEKTGTALRIPIHPALKRSLHAYGIKGRHLIGKVDGQPMNGDLLSKMVIAAAAEAKLPRRCVPHGIRKAVMRQLAEGGTSSKHIAALSGHKTLKEIERYTEAANQGSMARAVIDAMPDKSRS